MPTTPTPTDPEVPLPAGDASAESAPDSDAPVTFIPHDPDGAVPSRPFRIRTSRGELNEHELLNLLDSIEDERARARFRESIYISVFFWIVVVWVLMYGPRYLWHAPKLINPIDAMKAHELTMLNAPRMPAITHVSPKLSPKTLSKIREMTPAPPARTSTPTPTSTAPPPPTNVAPTPSTAPPLPSAPTPQPSRTPPPIVADAPTPQPSSKPSFSSGGSASSSMDQAMRGSSHGNGNGPISGSTRGRGGQSMGGGVEILSDTQGVDFTEYIKRVIADVERNWQPLLPEETFPPLMKEGEAEIRFMIMPDGRIGAMHLDGSSHDDAINRSCWGSITSEGQFQPLPSKFHGPNLELRFHYSVNRDHSDRER